MRIVRFRVVRVAASKVPCADPLAVIHMALSELGEDEGLEIIAPRRDANLVRKALRELGDALTVIEERVEDDEYRVRVAPRRQGS